MSAAWIKLADLFEVRRRKSRDPVLVGTDAKGRRYTVIARHQPRYGDPTATLFLEESADGPAAD